MDSALTARPFPSMTTQQLRDYAPRCPADVLPKVEAEIARREKVAAGDVTVMTPVERLRHNDQQAAKTEQSALVDALYGIDPQLAVWASQRISEGLSVHQIKARLRRATISSGRE